MTSKSDLKFIQHAMLIAENSPCYNQHGCVLVQNGKIISHGYNHYEVSKHSLSINTTHAEIDALIKYFKSKNINQKFLKKKNSKKKNSNKVTIYIIKIKNNQLSNSAPCCMCTQILKMSNIVKKIIYSGDDGNLISVRMRDYETQHMSIGDRCNNHNNSITHCCR
jgi:deoxycytidylate deaminase